ncbi:acyl dehydratase [Nocardia transvalensis]|uniref:Acyl dehydratase n=1 Tax=Nocardia transvalensis TaxID=37333 RepID=A0A7W9PMJ7_9NOCA|nr:MaoC/PaaZ C-terminal domain-containing protein [Nocardia transvalensis]MBB5918832.1 acyl dehydratase [Nocardia transvalensis]
MPIDVRAAVGVAVPEQEFGWAEEDVLRYRRAVGQGARQRGMLPTFAMTAPAAFGVASPDFYQPEPPEIRFPGIRLNLATLLHLEQELVVPAPLPRTGCARCTGEVVGIEERGDAAVLVQRTTLRGDDGAALVSGISRIHARGEGGAGGGSRGTAIAPTPDRRPDAEIRTPTSPSQAVWYQACVRGASLHDNIHTDEIFARAAGFPGPILQGVCTYGMVCAALVDAVAESDAGRVRRYTARFRGIAFPGESLHTRIWDEGDRYIFLTTVPERADKPVLSGEFGIR